VGESFSASPERTGPADVGAGQDPPGVWRLRSRGCWTEAAALLAERGGTDAGTALRRARLLIERCVFTAEGWAEAEDALRTAEALAATDAERGRAACERGQLAYVSTFRTRAQRGAAAAGDAGPGAAGLPARPDHRTPGARSGRRPSGVPARARAGHRAGRPAAVLLHLAAPGRDRAAGRGDRGGPARLQRVAAPARGAGLPHRHSPGAGVAGGGGAGPRGGPAAGGGVPAVPAAGRPAGLAGGRTGRERGQRGRDRLRGGRRRGAA
jgi:hypothetical protein